MDRLYTVRETANLLRCSARTVRRMIGAGELPAIPLRVGAGSKRQQISWRVRESALERFLRARERVALDTRGSIGPQQRRTQSLQRQVSGSHCAEQANGEP